MSCCTLLSWVVIPVVLLHAPYRKRYNLRQWVQVKLFNCATFCSNSCNVRFVTISFGIFPVFWRPWIGVVLSLTHFCLVIDYAKIAFSCLALVLPAFRACRAGLLFPVYKTFVCGVFKLLFISISVVGLPSASKKRGGGQGTCGGTERKVLGAPHDWSSLPLCRMASLRSVLTVGAKRQKYVLELAQRSVVMTVVRAVGNTVRAHPVAKSCASQKEASMWLFCRGLLKSRFPGTRVGRSFSRMGDSALKSSTALIVDRRLLQHYARDRLRDYLLIIGNFLSSWLPMLFAKLPPVFRVFVRSLCL